MIKIKKRFQIGFIVFLLIVLIPVIAEVVHFVRRTIRISDHIHSSYGKIDYSINHVTYPRSFAGCQCGTLTAFNFEQIKTESFMLHDTTYDFDFMVYVNDFSCEDDYLEHFRGKKIKNSMSDKIFFPDNCSVECFEIFVIQDKQTSMQSPSVEAEELRNIEDSMYVLSLQNGIKSNTKIDLTIKMTGDSKAARIAFAEVYNYLCTISKDVSLYNCQINNVYCDRNMFSVD